MVSDEASSYLNDPAYARAKAIQLGSQLWRSRLLNTSWFGFGFAIWIAHFFDRVLRTAIGLADKIGAAVGAWNWLTDFVVWRWTVGWVWDAPRYKCPPELKPYCWIFALGTVSVLLAIISYVGRWVYFDARARSLESHTPSDFALKAVGGVVAWLATFALLEIFCGPLYSFLAQVPK